MLMIGRRPLAFAVTLYSSLTMATMLLFLLLPISMAWGGEVGLVITLRGLAGTTLSDLNDAGSIVMP